jgi:hypothetical protein
MLMRGPSSFMLPGGGVGFPRSRSGGPLPAPGPSAVAGAAAHIQVVELTMPGPVHLG